MEYVFPGAYGGAVKSDAPPQIHNLIKALRRSVGSLAAKRQQGGPMFPVRGAKELTQKLAEALDELNMVAYPISQEVTHLPTNEIPKNENKSGNPVFRTLTHVKTTVRVVAPDTSFMDCVGSGHGGDVDDKAGGKADTYAWKSALLKGLTIPDADMVDTDDEAPSSSPAKSGNRPAADTKGGGVTAGTHSVGEAVRGAGATAGPSGRLDGPSEAVGESPAGLDYVLGRIEAADSDSALEDIRQAILKGILALHGSDRLKATAAWTKKKEALKKAGA